MDLYTAMLRQLNNEIQCVIQMSLKMQRGQTEMQMIEKMFSNLLEQRDYIFKKMEQLDQEDTGTLNFSISNVPKINQKTADDSDKVNIDNVSSYEIMSEITGSDNE